MLKKELCQQRCASGGGVGEDLHLKKPPFLGVCFKTQKSKEEWWIAAHFRSEVALAHTPWLYIISRICVALDLGVGARAQEQPLGSPGLVQLKGCQSLSLGRGWGWELHLPFTEQALGSQTSNRRPEPRLSKLCQAKRTFYLTHPENWHMGHKGHIFQVPTTCQTLG